MCATVLITGAAGRIGSALVRHLDNLEGEPYNLRLGDVAEVGDRGMFLDITQLASCRQACEGVDIIVHLAALASPESPFEDILPVNIVGTYNIFRAASDAGVRRVVFASSIQTVEGYPPDVQVRTDMPVRPKNIYGVSKASGEALASYFAYQEGVEAVVVRIGAFEPSQAWTQMDSRDLSAWSSPEDTCMLLTLCIAAHLSDDPFMVAHAISNNRFKRVDLTDTRVRLGYAPRYDAFSVWNTGLPESSEPA